MTQSIFNPQNLQTLLASDGITPSTAMTAALVSAPFNINFSKTFAMAFIWTGTPTGILSIMGSLDGINYNIQFGTHAIAGAAGNYSLDLGATSNLSTSCGWVRGQYAFTSGTGVLSLVQAAAKYPSLT